MLTLKSKLLSFFLLGCLTLPIFASSTHWQQLAPGLNYAEIPSGIGLFSGTIHAFKIDLTKYKLSLAFSSELQKSTTTISDLVKTNHAALGINGGFFTPKSQSLGLRLKNGLIISPLREISWWGVFYVMNNQPMIVSSNNFKPNNKISFAIQCGPRLIINGTIPSLKPGVDDRSALGITSDNKVIIVATENVPLTTQQLAMIMLKPDQQGGLGCMNAINLDGGTSTQLYAKIQDFILNIPGFKSIADAVLVFPKS